VVVSRQNALLLALAILFLCPKANAEPIQLPAALHCTPFSISPKKNPAFTAYILFNFADGKFSAERITRNRPGKSVFDGTLNKDGTIQIEGRGAYYNHNSGWAYHFSGNVKETILKGSLRSLINSGSRRCILFFLVNPTEFSDKLGLKTSPAQSASKPSLASNQLNTQLAKMQKELEETKKQLNDQHVLAQHQADTEQQLKIESDELAEIKKQLDIQHQLMQHQADAEKSGVKTPSVSNQVSTQLGRSDDLTI
jgi:hypothetical protein